MGGKDLLHEDVSDDVHAEEKPEETQHVDDDQERFAQNRHTRYEDKTIYIKAFLLVCL